MSLFFRVVAFTAAGVAIGCLLGPGGAIAGGKIGASAALGGGS